MNAVTPFIAAVLLIHGLLIFQNEVCRGRSCVVGEPQVIFKHTVAGFSEIGQELIAVRVLVKIAHEHSPRLITNKKQSPIKAHHMVEPCENAITNGVQI